MKESLLMSSLWNGGASLRNVWTRYVDDRPE